MSGIQGKDTRPEMALCRLLHGLGFRNRLHVKGLLGKPDLVFPRYRAIERDRRAIERLTADGWRVAVVWECALKQRQDAEVAAQLATWLRSDVSFIEIPASPPEPMPAKR